MSASASGAACPSGSAAGSSAKPSDRLALTGPKGPSLSGSGRTFPVDRTTPAPPPGGGLDVPPIPGPPMTTDPSTLPPLVDEPAIPVRTTDVTAVLVVHEGAAWLPDALAALAASTIRPRHVVCVDTGSRDDGPALLRAAGEDGLIDLVLTLPATTGYGAAVAAALDAVPPGDWVWLLHDDCAPDSDALDA